MTGLILTILASSLVGSFHCAGMCGAFLTLAITPVGVGEGGLAVAMNSSQRLAMITRYNLGRLASYTTLGALAGTLGSVVDVSAASVGVQRAAAIVAGTVTLVFGLGLLARAMGRQVWKARVPAPLMRVAHAAFLAADRLPTSARPLAIGLATGLLPCGWLWVYVATASGTASPLNGAVAMAAFWLGTLPIMTALGLGVQKFFGVVGNRLPLAAALAIVAVSFSTIIVRVAVPCHTTTHATGTLEVCSPHE
jgi:sulfite exporter TauE/SafE